MPTLGGRGNDQVNRFARSMHRHKFSIHSGKIINSLCSFNLFPANKCSHPGQVRLGKHILF